MNYEPLIIFACTLRYTNLRYFMTISWVVRTGGRMCMINIKQCYISYFRRVKSANACKNWLGVCLLNSLCRYKRNLALNSARNPLYSIYCPYSVGMLH